MDISIEELRRLMLTALSLRGMTGTAAEFVVEDYLDAQLEGKPTHGVGKFLLIDAYLAERQGKPKIISRSGATVLLDGQREIGQLAASQAAEIAISLAEEHSIGLVGLRNFARFGRLSPYGHIISRAGFIGVITNSAGPPAVVPSGAAEPLLGSNPICFAFPSDESPVVMDFSSAARPWGEIRQAILEGRPLSDSAFVDQDGNATSDPERAEGVMPFGGHKGYALCLSLELLAGTLTGTAMGRDVVTQYDLGAIFLAINPVSMVPGNNPKFTVTRLKNAILNLRPKFPQTKVIVPGDRSAERRAEAMREGIIAVNTETVERLREMSISLQGGLPSNDKLN